jgi:hypothetical protein
MHCTICDWSRICHSYTPLASSELMCLPLQSSLLSLACSLACQSTCRSARPSIQPADRLLRLCQRSDVRKSRGNIMQRERMRHSGAVSVALLDHVTVLLTRKDPARRATMLAKGYLGHGCTRHRVHSKHQNHKGARSPKTLAPTQTLPDTLDLYSNPSYSYCPSRSNLSSGSI